MFRIGDATVVCWSRSAKPAYAALFGGVTFGSAVPSYTENDLRGMVKSLCAGRPVIYEGDKLDPGMDFYVLGLSPNAARLSVRFFLHNTFGAFLRNIQAHYDRLEIIRPAYDKFDALPLWKLLSETVNQNSRDKSPAPDLAGEVLRAVLMNTRYPATLLNGVTLRIRAEREVTRGRAAIIKACLLQNYRYKPIYSELEEVLQVELNDACNYQPYVLGRLFAVMEKIQLASTDWNINRTIKDSYFTSAASTPKNIFAKLFPLSEYHMKKLSRDKPGLANTLTKEKVALVSKLIAPIPSRFSSEETDCFYIGYYHQIT